MKPYPYHSRCHDTKRPEPHISEFRLRFNRQRRSRRMKGVGSCHPRDTRAGSCRGDRERSWAGFNEDRRICPIKVSCKEPRRSTVVRSQNIEFQRRCNNLFLSCTSTNLNRYPFCYRHRAPPLEPGPS